jgi:hypothetical protein
LFHDRVRGTGGGSMKPTNAAFSRRQRILLPAFRKWHAATALTAAFCVDGSKS